jgi:AcrR family transcriptional regulator
MRVRENTRERIKEVALELFTEQGYESTSLREIAERLGVTKAALYYHFKSKDEIVTSFVEDRLQRLDDLIKLAGELPPGPERRREVIDRYARVFFEGGQASVMRFFEQNQAVVKGHAAGIGMRERLFRIAELLSEPDGTPAGQLRAAMAIFAVHGSWFAVRSPTITDEERRTVALEVAQELLDGMDRPI